MKVCRYYVYVLKSLKDNKYYIGQTNNLKHRVNLHNSGKVLSTKSRRPFTLEGYKQFKTRSEARWYEYEVKHHSDKKRKLIKEIMNK